MAITTIKKLASALVLAGLCTGAAMAQEFPTKSVRIITPFPVGSGPEAALRLLANKLEKMWGKPVVVENKPGANGFIAIDAFKQGSQDGHDLIQLDNVHLVAYPHLFKKLPYDPKNDFEQIAPIFRTYFFVATGTNSPYKNVADIIADAKKRPGALNYGSWSVGNPVHLGSALLETMTGTDMVHVVYKETSMLYTGVASGELNFALGTAATTRAMYQAGKLKYLAVAAPKRNPNFPDVPTVAEAGGPAGYEVTGWTTLAAPKNVSKAVLDKIQRDVEKALMDNETKDRYQPFGYEQFPVSRDQFNAFIQTEYNRYGDVVRKTKASLD